MARVSYVARAISGSSVRLPDRNGQESGNVAEEPTDSRMCAVSSARRAFGERRTRLTIPGNLSGWMINPASACFATTTLSLGGSFWPATCSAATVKPPTFTPPSRLGS